MAYGYAYGGYPTAGGYYAPPMPDQLAQLRGAGQYQPQMMGQNVGQPIPTQPVQNPAPMAAQTPQATGSGILWVQGEEGAKAWLVAPGATVMLMDSDGSSFYLKSADASGMPQPLRIFDYTERTATPKSAADATQIPPSDYVTRDEWNALAARADALAAELEDLKVRKSATQKKNKEADE